MSEAVVGSRDILLDLFHQVMVTTIFGAMLDSNLISASFIHERTNFLVAQVTTCTIRASIFVTHGLLVTIVIGYE